jgi:selenide,water dikinase
VATRKLAQLSGKTYVDTIKLTQFSHGGGCGCKIAPAVLKDILAQSAPMAGFANLLVGTESSDDAAVYRLNDSQAIVATTDFFMPIVDDAFDFGRIAATNALSDIYAMGGKPLFALAIVGMPVGKLPVETIRQILAGGEAVCREAGIPIAGGHSIDAPEPIYGLVGIGVVHPDRVKRNNAAKPGDVLILGKPLGVGILSAALKKGQLSAEGYLKMIEITTQLNTVGSALSELDGVHAMTDVTGFALLGHLLEIARGSQLSAQVHFDRVPVIEEALLHAQAGVATGAAERNWASFGEDVDVGAGVAEWQRALLCDPQTSGGLLIACDPSVENEVLAAFQQQGFAAARTIGQFGAGAPRVLVSAS